MDAAGRLARREEAGDDVSVGVNDFRIGVDLDAAHGVVDARGDLDRVVRRGGEIRVHAVVAAELRVLALGDGLVPRVHGVHKVLHGVARETHVLGELLIGVARDGKAAVDELLREGDLILQMLVEDDEAVAVRLLELSLRHDVAAREVVDKALALGVHDDRAVAAHGLGEVGCSWICSMSTVSAPTACAIRMPSPVAPEWLVVTALRRLSS